MAFFYLHKICLEYPWGLPFARDLAWNANCKNTPRKPKAWPGATLLFVGGRENEEGEKIWSVVTVLCKLKTRHKSKDFMKCQPGGQVGESLL